MCGVNNPLYADDISDLPDKELAGVRTATRIVHLQPPRVAYLGLVVIGISRPQVRHANFLASAFGRDKSDSFPSLRK